MTVVAVLLAAALHAAGADKPKATMECHLKVRDKSANPVWGKYAEVHLCNHTAQGLALETNLSSGVLTFIDVQVTNAAGKRVSKPFHDASIASPAAEAKVVATLDPGKTLAHHVGLFGSLDGDDLKPGRYKVRVRFQYKGVDVTSNEVEVELTQAQIDDFPMPPGM